MSPRHIEGVYDILNFMTVDVGDVVRICDPDGNWHNVLATVDEIHDRRRIDVAIPGVGIRTFDLRDIVKVANQ